MCDDAGEITGLIDWGDACHSWLVAEAAVAACYMMQLTVRQRPFHSAAALLVRDTAAGAVPLTHHSSLIEYPVCLPANRTV